MTTKSTPQVPPKLPIFRPLSRLTDTFAFHASPETFIASRLNSLASNSNNAVEEAVRSRAAVHATILNRNVAIISSHRQIEYLLTLQDENEDRDPALVATAAYQQFMSDFYPSPNLLLSDGTTHEEMQRPWKACMNMLMPVTNLVKNVILDHFSSLSSRPGEGDLYDSLKCLTWKILLQLFLGLKEADAEFAEFETLQEDLLRGQFSLFPAAVDLRFWKSPRSRGLAAKDKLLSLIRWRIENRKVGCPFQTETDIGLDEKVNHILLFTSSLAVKAIASLLTVFLLNVFLFDQGDLKLIDQILSLGQDDREKLLQSTLSETERLTPPIAGIMRRVTRDLVIPSSEANGADVLIPKGWDAWLYFAGAGRDAEIFGSSCNFFVPDRFLDSNTAPGFAFSIGSKACLGRDMVREMCLTVARTLIDDGWNMEGELPMGAIRSWLGWQNENQIEWEAWSREVKQLPTQRPVTPIKVKFKKGREV